MFHLKAKPRPPSLIGARHARPGGGFLGDRDRAGAAFRDHGVDSRAGSRSLPGSRGRRRCWESIRPACGCSRDTASRRPHRRAAHRRGNAPANGRRWRSGSRAPRGGRNCRWRCSSPGGSLRADRHARTARVPSKRARPCASVGKMRRHPVEDHADAGLVAAHRRSGQKPSERAEPRRSARTGPAADSPRSRRTGVPRPA